MRLLINPLQEKLARLLAHLHLAAVADFLDEFFFIGGDVENYAVGLFKECHGGKYTTKCIRSVNKFVWEAFLIPLAVKLGPEPVGKSGGYNTLGFGNGAEEITDPHWVGGLVSQ